MVKQDGAAAFLAYWKMLADKKLPEPTPELKFSLLRKWRFDWGWEEPRRVAVEIDGGQWTQFGGRHARDSDREKTNLASEMGWLVFHYSPQMLEADPHKCVRQVERALQVQAKKGVDNGRRTR